jgi:hypothetical protein
MVVEVWVVVVKVEVKKAAVVRMSKYRSQKYNQRFPKTHLAKLDTNNMLSDHLLL